MAHEWNFLLKQQSGPFANIMCKYLKSTECESFFRRITMFSLRIFYILDIFKSAKTRNQEATILEESNCEDDDDDLDAHMLHYCFDKTT